MNTWARPKTNRYGGPGTYHIFQLTATLSRMLRDVCMRRGAVLNPCWRANNFQTIVTGRSLPRDDRSKSRKCATWFIKNVFIGRREARWIFFSRHTREGIFSVQRVFTRNKSFEAFQPKLTLNISFRCGLFSAQLRVNSVHVNAWKVSELVRGWSCSEIIVGVWTVWATDAFLGKFWCFMSLYLISYRIPNEYTGPGSVVRTSRLTFRNIRENRGFIIFLASSLRFCITFLKFTHCLVTAIGDTFVCWQ